MVDMRVKKCGSNPEFITQCEVHQGTIAMHGVYNYYTSRPVSIGVHPLHHRNCTVQGIVIAIATENWNFILGLLWPW